MRQIRNTVTVLLGIAAAWWLLSQVLATLGLFADVLAIFGFAWLLNLLLEPMVENMARRIPRTYAWLLGYLCVVLVIAALTAPLATQASTLPAALPGAIDQATHQVDSFLNWLREHRITVPVSLQESIESGELAQQIGPILLSWSLALFSIGGQTLLVIGVAAAMAAGDNSLRRIIVAAVPVHLIDDVEWLYHDVRRTYSAAIRGQLAIWALGMALSLGAMALFNTPNILLWIGPLALVRLLPYLGGVLGGALTVVILLLTLPWPIALIPVLLVIIGQNVMGYVIEPRLLGRALRLSPALVLFVVLVGWKLGGVTGIAFGLPAVAVIQALAERLISQHERPSTRARSVQPTGESTASQPPKPAPTPVAPPATNPLPDPANPAGGV